MPHPDDLTASLTPFLDEGLIGSIEYEVKSGKEATVFCCTGDGPYVGRLLAAKVYRPIESRQFKDDSMYLAGRVHMVLGGRLARAAKKKTAFGREVQYGTWLYHEWEMMQRLHAAGADTLEPLAQADLAILMPFVGDEDGPAPLLHEAEVSTMDVESIIDLLLDNIALMLDLHIVHGDLSPYNILLARTGAIIGPTIIDFPQAVDPRMNPSAFMLFCRDVEKVCAWAERHGVHRPATSIAMDLWGRFVEGAIG